jgi:hypothetical protein
MSVNGVSGNGGNLRVADPVDPAPQPDPAPAPVEEPRQPVAPRTGGGPIS